MVVVIFLVCVFIGWVIGKLLVYLKVNLVVCVDVDIRLVVVVVEVIEVVFRKWWCVILLVDCFICLFFVCLFVILKIVEFGVIRGVGLGV